MESGMLPALALGRDWPECHGTIVRCPVSSQEWLLTLHGFLDFKAPLSWRFERSMETSQCTSWRDSPPVA